MLDHLRKLPVNVVETFLEVRNAKKCGVPTGLADFILQINDAYNLNKRYRSITTCAEVLRRNWPDLSLSTCRSRIYDAVSFFNSQTTVTAPEWNLYFADYMMDVADLCLIDHDWGAVDRFVTKARNWRLEASANIIDKERTKFRPQLVSADFKLDRMGDLATNKGILDCWREVQEIINDNVDASQSEKDRLKDEAARELGIETIEGEPIDE